MHRSTSNRARASSIYVLMTGYIKFAGRRVRDCLAVQRKELNNKMFRLNLR